MSDNLPARSANPTVALLQSREAALAKLVGEDNIALFMANVLAQLRKDTKLLKCEPGSFYAAAHQAATLGLQPGPLGHCYLVPYGRQATLLTGYKGLMELARRHRDVRDVEAKMVFDCEVASFRFDHQTNEVTHHWAPGPRTQETFYACYSRVWLHYSARPLVLMFDRAQVEERRERSAAKGSNFWTKDWLAMARKTVIRAHYNGGEVPLSAQLQKALDHEIELERKAEILSVRTEPAAEPMDDNVQVGFDTDVPEGEQDCFGLDEPEAQ